MRWGGSTTDSGSGTVVEGEDAASIWRCSLERSATPMPSTAAPKPIASRVRSAIGSPENGARMVRTPRTIRILERDIGRF